MIPYDQVPTYYSTLYHVPVDHNIWNIWITFNRYQIISFGVQVFRIFLLPQSFVKHPLCTVSENTSYKYSVYCFLDYNMMFQVIHAAAILMAQVTLPLKLGEACFWEALVSIFKSACCHNPDYHNLKKKNTPLWQRQILVRNVWSLSFYISTVSCVCDIMIYWATELFSSRWTCL